MKLKLTKLDKRNTGYGTWKFYVELKLLDKNYGVDLCNVREWCWTHWGPSKELDAYHQHDLFDGVSCSNPRWCWQHDEYRTRIYLRDEPETIAFALKWF
jgi:hypothetical protein|tara:strand:- start:518 stop:814 length:297 start_codon:yes stop_codon:yes gene_type:complete